MSLQTALHDWHASHGGRMVDFAGWHMPVQYTTLVDEHNTVRNAVGLFDIAHMGRLRFDGPDACALLDSLLTNDVSKLAVGDVRYSLVCNESGGILDDVLVYRFPDHYGLVVNASNREKIVAWIEGHRSPFRCEITDETVGTFMFAVQGPKALETLISLTSAPLSAMKYYSVLTGSVAGVDAVISRTGYTGEDGYEVVVPNSAAVATWEAVLAAAGKFGGKPCGLGARDTLRLEAAMPLYGHELSESIDPLTAGLQFGVKLKKAADFGGKAALLNVQEAGVKQARVGLKLDSPRIPREHMPVAKDGAVVGEVTSGTKSPTLGASIAMAYVPTEFAGVGTRLQVDIRGNLEPATVVALPFYKRG
jgi:aminomethyltransferase